MVIIAHDDDAWRAQCWTRGAIQGFVSMHGQEISGRIAEGHKGTSCT